MYQLLRITVLWVLKDLIDQPLFDHLTMAHHHNPIRQRLDDTKVMTDDNHGNPSRKRVKIFEYPEVRSKVIYVNGEVKRIGAIGYREGISLGEAIKKSGGKNVQASDEIKLQRAGKTYTYNLNNPKHLEIKLHQKDRIYVIMKVEAKILRDRQALKKDWRKF